jgi:hypothetical protein
LYPSISGRCNSKEKIIVPVCNDDPYWYLLKRWNLIDSGVREKLSFLYWILLLWKSSWSNDWHISNKILKILGNRNIEKEGHKIRTFVRSESQSSHITELAAELISRMNHGMSLSSMFQCSILCSVARVW